MNLLLNLMKWWRITGEGAGGGRKAIGNIAMWRIKTNSDRKRLSYVICDKLRRIAASCGELRRIAANFCELRRTVASNGELWWIFRRSAVRWSGLKALPEIRRRDLASPTFSDRKEKNRQNRQTKKKTKKPPDGIER